LHDFPPVWFQGQLHRDCRKQRSPHSMPPKTEKRGRGRAKRPRESPREEGATQGFAPANYSSQSNAVRPGTTFSHPLPPQSSPAPNSRTVNTSATSEFHSAHPINVITSHPPPGKVAIPALRQPQNFEASSKGSKKGRTSHACDYCRKAKAGCSGEQPCSRCRSARVACVYGDGKREQDRK
jgi:hypothetical protein